MSPEVRNLIASIRAADHGGRHDGAGRSIIGVDFYQEAALKACDQIEEVYDAILEVFACDFLKRKAEP